MRSSRTKEKIPEKKIQKPELSPEQFIGIQREKTRAKKIQFKILRYFSFLIRFCLNKAEKRSA